MGNQIFLTIVSLSLSGALIGILILCLRPLTRRLFSKRWNYYIWLVMTARLLIPVSLGINLMGSLFTAGNEWNSARTENAIRTESAIRTENAIGEETDQVTTDQQLKYGSSAITDREQLKISSEKISSEKSVRFPLNGQTVFSYLWLVWLFGAVLSACVKGNDYRNFAAYVKADQKEITEGKVRQTVDELSGRLGIKRVLKVYESPMVSGPILIGLLRPCIILPEGSLAQEELSLILHHELIHYKKKDLWYKWLYQAVLCIHWFNPLLYLIERKLNMDCELACDEAVMEILTMEGRKAYGNVLLDAAEQKLKFKKSVLATTFLEDKGTLKERVNAILYYKKTKGILVAFSICLLGVIVVLAGFAGAKNSKSHNVHSAAGMFMAGDYISAWDSGSSDYISLWDTIGKTVGTVWDSLGQTWDNLGQMWGDLGDALSDAMTITGERYEMVISDFNIHGEAWKVYEDDKAIAGKDINDRWRAYDYMGNGNGMDVDCKELILNGSDTYEILYAKEAFTQTLDFEAELAAGKMKLVHVGADGSVTLLAELEAGDSFNTSVSIPLTEGRNAVKIVGQGAQIRNLHFKFHDKNNKNVMKIFASDVDEAAGQICDEFRQGNVNIEKFMEVLPYLKQDELNECAKILFDSGADLTMDQITDLVIYGDDQIGKYLADAVEKGTMRALTGDEIMELVYYISSADALRLVECMKETMDFDTLREFLVYLDAKDGESCLNIYLEQGNELSYEEFSEISYYLEEDVAKRLYEKRK